MDMSSLMRVSSVAGTRFPIVFLSSQWGYPLSAGAMNDEAQLEHGARRRAGSG